MYSYNYSYSKNTVHGADVRFWQFIDIGPPLGKKSKLCFYYFIIFFSKIHASFMEVWVDFVTVWMGLLGCLGSVFD